jgi:renal tumor antigen
MHKYRLVAKKGEGTFSEVLKAQSVKNGKCFAIKCMKNYFDSIEQVNNLREIQALRRLSPCPHIVKLYEVLFDKPTGRLALVFELMEMNIYELIRGRRHYLPEDMILNYMFQLAKSLDHMHRHGIFHRDIKPENILIVDKVLKLADFGSCRGIYSKQPYTEYISTRWYRAPECLLTDGYYGYKMDMWGVGSVMFEVIALYPLFPGTNEVDQVHKIHHVLGTPPNEILQKFWRYRSSHIDFNFPQQKGLGIPSMIPHASADAIDLIMKLLAYDPEERISARQTLHHPYFKQLHTQLAQEEQAQAAAQGAQRQGGGQDTAQSSVPPAASGGDMQSKPSKKQAAKEKAAAAAAAGAGGAGSTFYDGPKATKEAEGSLPFINKGQMEKNSKSVNAGEVAPAAKPKKATKMNRTVPLVEEEYLPPIASSLHNLKIDNTAQAKPKPVAQAQPPKNKYKKSNTGAGKLKLGHSHRRHQSKRRAAKDKDYDTNSYLQVSSYHS